jgi:ribosomal protein L31
MPKKNLHPKWFAAKVFFHGTVIFEVGSTKEKLNVTTWSGVHTSFTNNITISKSKASDIKDKM